MDIRLRFMQSLARKLSCSQTLFRRFALATPDGIMGPETAAIIRTFNDQLPGFGNAGTSVLSDRMYGWLASNYGSDWKALAESCGHLIDEPAPVDPPTPDPDPDPRPVPPSGIIGTPHMVVVNRSNASNTVVREWANAVEYQLKDHATPHYGYTEFRFAADNTPREDEWVITIEDRTDLRGAGGYHGADGLKYEPYGKVFLDSGNPSGVLSHEALEIRYDPYANFYSRFSATKLWIMEACDATQADYYDINGVSVSNFLFPAWWGDFGEARGEYDYLGLITRPYEIRRGGYQIVLNTQTNTFETPTASGEVVPPGPGCEYRHMLRTGGVWPQNL